MADRKWLHLPWWWWVMDLTGFLSGLSKLEPPKTWTELFIIIGVAVAATVAATQAVRWIYGRTRKPTARPGVPSRAFLPGTVTPAALVALRGDQMTAHADRAVGPYLGKWMRLRRTVGDIDGRPGRLRVHTYDRDAENKRQGPTAFLYFGKNWDDRLNVMPRGTEITVEGKLYQVGDGYVALEDCELVEDKG